MTTTTEGRSLHRKLAQIMYEAERIPKRGKAPAAMGGFDFVQVGDAADFIRKALAEHVISMLPTAIEILGQTEHATKSGGSMTTVDIRTTWTLTDGESGESIQIQSYGAGADGGDKYSGKAQTSAMKYALLMGFLLSTGDDPELSNSEDRRARKSETTVLTAGVTADEIPPPKQSDDGGLIGIAEVGTAKDSDFELRETPDGWALGFRLKGDKGGIKVVARDDLAQALATMKGDVIDTRVTVYGRIRDESFRPKGAKRDVVYQVLDLERIRTPDWELPGRTVTVTGVGEMPLPVVPGQELLPLDEAERAAIAGDLS